MNTIDPTPYITDSSTVEPANNINSPGRSVPTKAQAEAHVNMIKSETYSHVSGSTYYPMKSGSGKTA